MASSMDPLEEASRFVARYGHKGSEGFSSIPLPSDEDKEELLKVCKSLVEKREKELGITK